MSSNKTTDDTTGAENDFLWDRSGTDDHGIGELAGALQKLRAPEPRIRLRRWWVAPAVFGAIASLLMFCLVLSERVPVQVIGLVSGQTGATPLMIKGGSRVEFEIVASSPSEETTNRLVDRLAEEGFETVFQSVDSIVATHVDHDNSIGDSESAEAQMVNELARAGLTSNLQIIELENTSEAKFASLREAAENEGGTVEGGVIEMTRGFATLVSKLRASGYDVVDSGSEALVVRNRDSLTGPLDILDVVRDNGVEILLSDSARVRLATLEDKDAQFAIVSKRERSPNPYNPYRLLGVATYGDLTPRGIKVEVVHSLVFHDIRYLETIRREGAVLVVTSSMRLGATISTVTVWLARTIFSLFSGLLIFLVAAVMARRARSLDPLVDRVLEGKRKRRLGLALGLASVIIACAFLAPSSPFGQLSLTLEEHPTQASVLSLGLMIFIIGFLCAYLGGLARRSWRRDMRLSTTGGMLRRGLIATAAVSIFAVIALAFDSTFNLLADNVDSLHGVAYVVAAVVGVAFLSFLGRSALGGPGVCFAAGFFGLLGWMAMGDITDLQATADFGGGSLLLVLLFGATLSVLTWRVLLTRTGPVGLRISPPLGGVFPLLLAIAGAKLLAQPLTDVLGDGYQFGFGFPLVSAIAVPLVLVFARLELYALRDLSSARVSSERASRRGEWSAILISVGFTLVAVALEVFGAAFHLTIFVPGTIVLTACVLDMVAEARALWRNPALKPAFAVHQAQLAPLVAHALDSQGIDVHLRAQYLRRCLGILGAFIPITAMVPPSQVQAAREIAESLLDVASTKK